MPAIVSIPRKLLKLNPQTCTYTVSLFFLFIFLPIFFPIFFLFL